MMQKLRYKMTHSGFSLLELLLVAAILTMLALGVSTAVSEFKRKSELNSSLQLGVSLLSEARARTLASEERSQFGVHFESDRMTLFKGESYSAGAPDNKEKILPLSIEIAQISLEGGGSDVIFNRLTGDTSQYGTIEMSIKEVSTYSATITIGERGTLHTE